MHASSGMMNSVKDAFYNFGSGAGDVARRFSHDSARTARRISRRSRRMASDIGPTRILIGLAITGVAIAGSIFLVRYLRAHRDEVEGELEDLTREGERKLGRAKRTVQSHLER
jgi:hypothetical protein